MVVVVARVKGMSAHHRRVKVEGVKHPGGSF